MVRRSWWICVIVLLPGTLLAQDERTVCVSGDVRHTVQIRHPEGWDLPCEVFFTTPDDARVIWRAEASLSFCEEKQAELVARRVADQWECYTEELFDAPALTNSSLFSDLPPVPR